MPQVAKKNTYVKVFDVTNCKCEEEAMLSLKKNWSNPRIHCTCKDVCGPCSLMVEHRSYEAAMWVRAPPWVRIPVTIQ